MGTSPVLELLKLPEFLTHYKEHKQEDASISLLDFIDMHYLHGNPMDDDYDKDMKLPFKKYNGSITQAFVAISINTLHYPALSFFSVVRTKKIFPTEDHFTSQYLQAIWQPPRV